MNNLQNILIVEDHDDDRYMLRSLLEGHKYHVVDTSNGREALEKLKTRRFDLIISDILMPEMDGYRLCQAVRADKKYANIPFVFYSATFTEKDDEILAKEVGASLFLQKPTEPEQLIRAIRDVVLNDHKPSGANNAKGNSNEIHALYSQSLIAKLAVKAADLQTSEIKYRTLFNTSTTAIILFDTNRLIDCNEACWRLFGYESKSEFLKIHPADLSPATQSCGIESPTLAQQHFQAAMKQGAYKCEWLYKKRDGNQFHAEVELGSMSLNGGAMAQGMIRDITQRKRIEHREQVRNDVLERLASNAPLAEILDCIAKSLQYEVCEICCSIMLFDENKKCLKLSAAPGMHECYKNAIETINMERDICARVTVMNSGESLLIDDIESNPNCDTYFEFAKDAGIRSCWSNPLKSRDGRIVGTITCHSKMNGMRVEENSDCMNFYIKLAELAIDRFFSDKQLKLADAIYQNSSEAMIITDKDKIIIAVNPAFTRITGYTREEVLGKNPRILSSGKHKKHFYQEMWQTINTNGYWQGEIWNKRKNGEVYAEWMTINVTFDAKGQVYQYIALFSDITEKKRKDALIINQANYDSLTQLPNRRLFNERLSEEIKKTHRTHSSLALLFIDLDRFKEVNDSFGHDMGDQLLIEAASRIRQCVREVDTVARLGGDEFTVILAGLSQSFSIERIASNIIESLSRPFKLGNDTGYVAASIGITLYPHDADNIKDLIRHADQAMYRAKSKGRGCFSYFTKAMQDVATNRMRLTNDLHRALELKQFQLYYQPIVNLTSGKIEKAEALIRWHHPTRGLVSPAEFIPLAEESGLINEIGDWIFKQAVEQVKQWKDQLQQHIQVSINKSPVQFRSAEHLDQWMSFIRDHGLSGDSLTVEITEGLLLDNNPVVSDQLLQLRGAGIQVSIDDFGTGYSALSYLKKFDIDYLKIDQSFIRNIKPESDEMALCEAIIVMAHKLRIHVIAEGVETKLQRKLLQAAGCNYAQGYLFSKPLPAAEFRKLL